MATAVGSPVSDPIIACYFSARIDQVDLGLWTQVELGGVELTMEQHEEGGDNLLVHQLPGRLKFQNIKLTRVVSRDTQKIGAWFRNMAGRVTRTPGQIVAYDRELSKLIEWNFLGAVPVRWSLPSLSTDGNKAATESLEIAHQGFVD